MHSTSSNPLALGFIGGSVKSAVGTAHHAAAGMDNVWNVAAGCFSRDPDTNRATGRAFGVAPARVHDNWRTMIAAERSTLDAIAVLTPIPDHAEIVAACLQAGIPVICEKAMATSSAEARLLRDVRDQNHGFLAITYNYTGYPMMRELRHLIRNGTLGKLIHFQVEMPQEGFIRTDPQGNKPAPQEWRLRDGAVPTIYLDLATHLHQTLHYLTGAQPLRAVAEQTSNGWFGDVVDDVTGLCRYSGGLTGNLWISKSAIGHRNGLRLRLYGTKGSAEWHQMEPEELRLNHSTGRRETLDRASDVAIANQPRYARFKPGHPAGFVEAFANLYRDIATSLLHWRETGDFISDEVFSAELEIEGLAFLEAMRDSAVTGQWQDVAADPASVRRMACATEQKELFLVGI
jgi:predicted dehydrogenase